MIMFLYNQNCKHNLWVIPSLSYSNADPVAVCGNPMGSGLGALRAWAGHMRTHTWVCSRCMLRILLMNAPRVYTRHGILIIFMASCLWADTCVVSATLQLVTCVRVVATTWLMNASACDGVSDRHPSKFSTVCCWYSCVLRTAIKSLC